MLHVPDNTLHIIDTLWLGGAQRVVQTLFERNRENTRLHLFVLRSTNEQMPVRHPCVTVDDRCGKWNFSRSVREVLQYIDQHGIKILHCHLPKSQTVGFLIKRFYRKDIRLIFHEQGDIMDRFAANLPVYLAGKRQIDFVLPCSGAVREVLTRKTGFPKEKTQVLYNFNHIQNPKPGAGDKPAEEEFRIGFAGRLAARKGWSYLIKAFYKLLADHPNINARLHIAGAGPDEGDLTKMIGDLKMKDKVILHGFVNDLESFYKRLDVLCVPSVIEPVGMVHIEAMSCGIPVIASDVPGMNEVLKHEQNCLLFPPKNTDGIYRSLLRIQSDLELRKRLANNGRSTADEFSYEVFERELSVVLIG